MDYNDWLTYYCLLAFGMILFPALAERLHLEKNYLLNILFFSLAFCLIRLNFYLRDLQNNEYWLDEMQMLVQAKVLSKGGIPWVNFDPTTSGPLNTLLLTLPTLWGQSISLESTRLIAQICYFIQIIMAFQISKKLYNKNPFLVTLPLIFLFLSLIHI